MRYTFLTVLLFCFGLTFAQTKNSNQTDTAVVQRATPDPAWAKFKIPYEYNGWVSDFEYLFSERQISFFEGMISKFEKETTMEIAVVTLDSELVKNLDFDSLVTNLGNTWGVGKKTLNNGVIIGISAKLRKIRISNGYGIETKISDAETKKIIDEAMIPLFKNADYFEGLKQGLSRLMDTLRNSKKGK
ncbi:MAG: TPM domain-containing protein [Ferruginibacter sp.]